MDPRVERAKRRIDNLPRPPSQSDIAMELERCGRDVEYFIDTYCQIYDNASSAWIPFKLWDGQREALRTVVANKYTIVLKARQEGLSWLLGDAYPLWKMIFRPIAQVLMFSQRDDEAIKILDRMKGTYERLPEWMKPGTRTNAAHEFVLNNGSAAQALPASTGGRSNAATYVFIDEADFIEHPAALVNFAKPTVDVGDNQLVLNSTVNKDTPGSYFQRLYASVRDNNMIQWGRVFLAWWAHPGRSQEWYETQCHDAMRLEGTLDSIYEQYPATDVEALSARTLDKRIPPQWIAMVYQERLPIIGLPDSAPIITGLRVYLLPEVGRKYALGVDPAEGNVRSDDSIIQVVDADNKQQCAVLAGKVEPDTLARYASQLATWYNGAPILPERNNHGHQLIAELSKLGVTLRNGEDGKAGWLNLRRRDHNTKIIVGSKVKLYDTAVKILQEHIVNAEESGIRPYPLIFNYETSTQLSSLDATTLSAPENQHDDYAVGWALAQMCAYRGVASMEIVQHNLYGPDPSVVPARPSDMARPTEYYKTDTEMVNRGIESLRARGLKGR